MNNCSRLFAAIILIGATLIIPMASGWAQGDNDVPPPPPCTPDCANVLWNPVQTVGLQISVCGAPCNVTVYYHTRSGVCGTTGTRINEFQVTQVELDANCPQQCQPDQYLAQVVFQMHLFNIPNFTLPLNLPDCITDRRASMSSCQFVWRSRSGRNYVVKCANSPECCVANYRVCYDQFGVVTSLNTIAPFMTPPNPCPDQGVVIGGVMPCRPSCNALKDLIDPYYGKPVFTNDPAEGGATVAPHPVKTNTMITSPEMPEGGALLMVYDARGMAVLNQRQDNREGKRYTFPVAVGNVPSGTYYYIIKSDKGDFIAGSLTVTR